MSTILVGLDDSETSRMAFHEAVREARWRSARVVALHVVHFPVVVGYEGTMYMPDLLKSGEDFMSRELGRLAESYDDGFGVDVKGEVRTGHAGVQLIEMAKDTGDGPAELVVLGSRGLGGFRGLLLGSVSTYAAHHLPCLLLMVPAASPSDVDG